MWNNLQHSKTFQHSEAHMPEMTANTDGFSNFHRLSNFIDARCPITVQYYHMYKHNPCKDVLVPYRVGEGVLYKQGDHVESEIIDKILFRKDQSAPMIDVRFHKNRKETAYLDNIQALDETDVSTVPTTNEDYNKHTKCLTHAELQMLKNPKQLTRLQQ